MTARVTARGLQKSYPQGGRPVAALAGIDLDLPAGAVVAVTGPSGSGKSTLLHCLSGLEEVDAGEVRILGRNLGGMAEAERARLRGRSMGFVFQAFHLLGVLTALQNVELALRLAGCGRRQVRERAQRALAEVGLLDRAHHLPSALSGGEQQRVAVARALAHRPGIVWADEPTGNLDRKSGRAVLALLRRAADQGATVVLVTHDATLAAQADHQVRLQDGRLAGDVL